MLILENLASALLLGAFFMLTVAYVRHVFRQDAEWKAKRRKR